MPNWFLFTFPHYNTFLVMCIHYWYSGLWKNQFGTPWNEILEEKCIKKNCRKCNWRLLVHEKWRLSRGRPLKSSISVFETRWNFFCCTINNKKALEVAHSIAWWIQYVDPLKMGREKKWDSWSLIKIYVHRTSFEFFSNYKSNMNSFVTLKRVSHEYLWSIVNIGLFFHKLLWIVIWW